jgi:hypothetical protein
MSILMALLYIARTDWNARAPFPQKQGANESSMTARHRHDHRKYRRKISEQITGKKS